MNPIMVLDHSGEILSCNISTCEVLGYDKTLIIGKQLKEFFPNAQYNMDVICSLTEKNELRNVETQIVNKEGEIKNILLSAMVVKDLRNEFQGTVVSLYDVTEMMQIRKELEEKNKKYKDLAEEFYFLSYYDQLTHLPNRRLFYEVIEKYWKEYVESKEEFTILYMDLDGFKMVNDSFGHKIGDQVLKIAAHKLKKVATDNHFLARMGGDEFACIVLGNVDPVHIGKIIEEIDREFETDIEVDSIVCKVGISVGYYFCSESLNIEELIKKADDAMYRQKYLKRNKSFDF